MTYKGFHRDRERAAENWTVTKNATQNGVRYVEAEAKTGSRYVVVASPLPVVGERAESGPVLVTVVWPWQDAWVFAGDPYFGYDYVAEHLCRDRDPDQLNGGDLQALYMTVRFALNGGSYDD